MTRLVPALAAFLALTLVTGCSGTPGDTDGDGDSDARPDAYPSDFETGKHRVTALTLAAEGEGDDFTGDGEPDNNLPFVLETADELVNEVDLSLVTFQEQIDTSIEDGSLNALVDSAYLEGELSIALLNGLRDEESGELSIDPESLSGGVPTTLLLGEFEDQTTFSVSADRAELRVPFTPDQPPSAVPLERVRLYGTLDGDVMDATIVGVIPSEEMANEVLADLIPEEGVGGRTKEELLSTLRTIAALPTIADVDLGNERVGVSCTFRVQGAAETWTE